MSHYGVWLLVLLTLTLSKISVAQLVLYDNFNAKQIDPARWIGERCSPDGFDAIRREVAVRLVGEENRLIALVSLVPTALYSMIAKTDAALVTGGQEVPARVSADSLEILRRCQTYHIKSGTIYLHSDVMQKALQQRPEFAAWHLKPSADPALADLTVEITLPFLSWEWNYKMVERATGRVLGNGKVKALEQQQAARLLASEITKEIESARGVPQLQGTAAPAPAHPQAALKKWHVQGASGERFADKDLTLSIGGGSISVSDPSGQGLEIPTRSVLSVYHTSSSLDSREKSHQRRKTWEAGWDKACEKTMGGEGCLAMYGIPIFLLGDAILMIPGPPTHLVAVRWQDDQAINELSFRADALEWKTILQNIQAEVPNSRLPIAAEAQELRKEFDAAWQKDLKISLGLTANVARWPPLQAGDYRIVVLERGDERAEIYFFMLADTQIDMPRALAVAHLTRVPRIATTPTVSFREQDGMRLIDEIRISNVLLGFD